ncbi:glycosyltransferase family 92 protein [Nitzschia inconspicua]|uniref:Glycosyltransferase family 92 protein n=1 Tax=Nitzschia inconspicua TaxID=303405 RepID=A0A9K3LA71_9STRA|nr:glycosyltransferase family 92 protein [Nitzschia inconspicua]
MGLRTPPTPPTSTFLGATRKRSRSGSPSIIIANSLPNSRKISQSTLQKFFVGMMTAAFSLYVAFTAYLIRHHHTNTDFGVGGKWGPNTEFNNDEVLKAHIQRIRELQQLKNSQEKGSPQAGMNQFLLNSHNKIVPSENGTNPVNENGGSSSKHASLTLEEVDIHEMKHPRERQKDTSRAQIIGPSARKEEIVHAVDKAPTSSWTATNRVLRAYLEPVYLSDWDIKPLPVRNTTKEQLQVIEYPRVVSCQKLPELWPIDDYPDGDPFLPWIHDVFPTDNGKYIQFVAQNKRRCQTGTTPDQEELLEKMQPQIALFQHVPIQILRNENNQKRYKLASHENADPSGIETRFICQFSNGEETLSRFNFNYDYVARRKHSSHTFTKEGHKDNKSIHTSQLIFQCPVPESLVEAVRQGTSVVEDQATLFVTLVPIRTPPRYGASDRFLPPRYQLLGFQNFSVQEEWGDSHILPLIEDSGRWENIPICLPTYKAFPKVTTAPPKNMVDRSPIEILQQSTRNTKKNRVVACTWASTSYATRGDRFAIDDGARRLNEWIRFHLLTGMDHIFVYDNSHGDYTLEPVTSQFPNQVTRIRWPATICNNNRTFHDSPGERSSQYAAESSCRLRFGPHTDWMASMDIDEYISPVGDYNSIQPFLDELDQNNTKIISFGSWRAWPRRDLIEPPVPIRNRTICDQPHPCFHLKIPTNRSILQTYNCDRQLVKKETMPAEKQIYRTDYVLQHFVHFSTVTLYTITTEDEITHAGMKWGKAAPDPLMRFANELTEVTMLHTKSMASQDTAGWEKRCKGEMKGSCRIGVSYPDLNTSSTVTKDENGWLYNCYVNPKIETHWVPLLHKELQSSSIIDFQT